MNLEPQKTSEIRTGGGVVRVLAMLTILVLATITVLVVIEVIPRSAFAELATRAALIAGVCVLSTVVIGLLARR